MTLAFVSSLYCGSLAHDNVWNQTCIQTQYYICCTVSIIEVQKGRSLKIACTCIYPLIYSKINSYYCKYLNT